MANVVYAALIDLEVRFLDLSIKWQNEDLGSIYKNTCRPIYTETNSGGHRNAVCSLCFLTEKFSIQKSNCSYWEKRILGILCTGANNALRFQTQRPEHVSFTPFKFTAGITIGLDNFAVGLSTCRAYRTIECLPVLSNILPHSWIYFSNVSSLVLHFAVKCSPYTFILLLLSWKSYMYFRFHEERSVASVVTVTRKYRTCNYMYVIVRSVLLRCRYCERTIGRGKNEVANISIPMVASKLLYSSAPLLFSALHIRAYML